MERNGSAEEGSIRDRLIATQESLEVHNNELQQLQSAHQQQAMQLNAVNHRLADANRWKRSPRPNAQNTTQPA
eukprot:2767216-Prymnesium_polylepis.1